MACSTSPSWLSRVKRASPVTSAAAVEEPGSRLNHIVIRPSTGWVPLRLGELWAYRELIYFLVWRDIKVRYKQTLLGAGWGILQPFLMMLVFTVFFAHLTDIPSDGLPYPIFAYTALVPWTYFAYALNHSSNVLVENASLIRRVYFPRLILPVASVMAGLLDLAIAFVLIIGFMVYYGIAPSWEIVFLPFFVVLTIGAVLAVGILFSALNIEFRDIRYTLPFVVQIWLLATPVAYPSSLVSEPWRTLLGINPMAGVVDGFRWSLLGADPPSAMIAVSVLTTVVVLVGGLAYFRRMERTFADVA